MNSFRKILVFSSKAILTLVFIFFYLINFSLAQNNNYIVVVNYKNSYKSSEENVIEKIKFLFYGNTKEWPGKIPATFYLSQNNNEAFNKFYSIILKEDANIVLEKLENKFSKFNLEKKIKNNARELINIVSKEEGAISIVSKKEVQKIPANIRVLYEF